MSRAPSARIARTHMTMAQHLAGHERRVQRDALNGAGRAPRDFSRWAPVALIAISLLGLTFLSGFLYGASGQPRAVAAIQGEG